MVVAVVRMNKQQPIFDVSYDTNKIVNTTTVMPIIPIVQNDVIPVEDEIVKGGILYADTKFNDPTDREKFDTSLYKFSEQAIVSSEFANKFNINIESTYNKEEVEQLTDKTFLELYPDFPSWNRVKFKDSVVHFTSVDNRPGDFLPSMYTATNYYYDNSTNQFKNEYISINLYVPHGSNVVNAANNCSIYLSCIITC